MCVCGCKLPDDSMATENWTASWPARGGWSQTCSNIDWIRLACSHRTIIFSAPWGVSKAKTCYAHFHRPHHSPNWWKLIFGQSEFICAPYHLACGWGCCVLCAQWKCIRRPNDSARSKSRNVNSNSIQARFDGPLDCQRTGREHFVVASVVPVAAPAPVIWASTHLWLMKWKWNVIDALAPEKCSTCGVMWPGDYKTCMRARRKCATVAIRN